MKPKKVFKYATGQSIPDGAVYLSTQVEKVYSLTHYGDGAITKVEENNTFVWHYFLVEVSKNKLSNTNL